ncbi:arsenate reductase ArsC [bacterium]|jgi:arsenate reductase|nr:arsenate reductase ArsC [bacterium]
MGKKKVLFICVHNSARSQMAEAYLKKFSPDDFDVESAGLEPGELNPVVVEAMKEDGIDISGNKTKSAHDFIRQGRKYDYVITVCDESGREKCPVFPGKVERLHWSFPDPSSLKGSAPEKLEKIREIRDSIKKRITDWLKEPR